MHGAAPNMYLLIKAQQKVAKAMEQQDVVKHFTDVATHYDDLYGFIHDYELEFAIKHLQLKPDDILADIGAGTGALSSLIWKKAGKEIKNRPGLDIGIRVVATQSTKLI